MWIFKNLPQETVNEFQPNLRFVLVITRSFTTPNVGRRQSPMKNHLKVNYGAPSLFQWRRTLRRHGRQADPPATMVEFFSLGLPIRASARAHCPFDLTLSVWRILYLDDSNHCQLRWAGDLALISIRFKFIVSERLQNTVKSCASYTKKRPFWITYELHTVHLRLAFVHFKHRALLLEVGWWHHTHSPQLWLRYTVELDLAPRRCRMSLSLRDSH